MLPRVFIGSSSEGLPIAYALQNNLECTAEATVWTQDVFRPSKFILESLIEQLGASDFGIFVFSPEDVVKMREVEHKTVRDNVLFELGLWIGHLGRERCAFVVQSDEPMHLPSDLLGVNFLSFRSNRADGNLEAALGPTSNRISNVLKSLKPDDYGIKITYPKPDEEVPLVFTTRGTYTKLPPGNSVIAIMLNEKSGEYWPKRDLIFDPYTMTWHAEVNNGSATTVQKIDRLLIIASIGGHARALVDFHRKTGNRTGSWMGFDYSPTVEKDIKRLAQVKVNLKNP